VRVLSLGAGVQSSTLLLMAVHGELHIDRAVFADTQWEPASVYSWLETLMPIAEKAGIPVDVVTGGNLRADAVGSRRSASIPLHVLNRDGSPGMLRRQCTKEYKVRPVQRRLRELGASSRTPVELLIGISRDEAQRMKPSRVKYAEHEYPLVNERMTRADAVGWLASKGYPEPPKSACIGCPFMDNRRWRDLHDNRPDEWADAVEFDAAIRHTTRIDGEAYLHRQLVPLPMVDLSTPDEARRARMALLGQRDMFDEIDEIDDGECGAFSCMGDLT
jgi:hypothetical protein